MIVPAAAGGPTDVIGRVVAERMKKSLGQTIIIENVSGADGNIGVGRAARARPDGYTVDLGIMSTHVLNGAFYSLPYDVLNDFAPISPLVTSPLVLFTRKTMPANDLQELIAWLEGQSQQGVCGNLHRRLPSCNRVLSEGNWDAICPRALSWRPPRIQDLVAGQIDLLFSTPLDLPLARAGSIKAFAVTSDTRLALAPELPTFAEIGLPALSFSAWYGLFAPKGTPKDTIGKLNAAAVGALANPAVRSRLIELGLEIFPREQQIPEALAALVKADAEKWWPIIKEFGIKAE